MYNVLYTFIMQIYLLLFYFDCKDWEITSKENMRFMKTYLKFFEFEKETD